jgi:hypothetical protein
MTPEISRSLREFQDYLDDVQRSGFQTFEDALNRLLSVLNETTPIGRVAHRALPSVDFDAWYAASLSNVGGLSGRGPLNWPHANAERVALQLDLLRKILDGRMDLFQFCHKFLTTSTRYDDMVHSFSQQVIRPFARDLVRLLHNEPELQEKTEQPATLQPADVVEMISTERIDAIRLASTSVHDLGKVIRLCEELNNCYLSGCYFAVAMLTRALLDHVPPLFGFRTFAEVVSNYAWGPSRRDAMEHLEKSARKIADVHLHSRASATEVLPNRAQVSFGPALDVLLGELLVRLQGSKVI